jgi:hypothetical protein
MDRRLAATCQHYRITKADLDGRVFAKSVRTAAMRLVTMLNNVPTINKDAAKWLLDFVRDNRLDVLIIDPLVSFHGAPENDNNAMDFLIKDVFGSIAEQTNAAVELCHHSGKPKQGLEEIGVEDSRGASAVIWAVRSARTLNFMTREVATTKLGIAEDQRRLHIRIANGKANLAPLGRAVWMKLVVEVLSNGDEIACATSWKPADPFDAASVADMVKCRSVAQGNAYRTSSQSPDWIGFPVAHILGINISFDGENDPKDVARVKELLQYLFENKVLAIEKRQDAHRKARNFVVPGLWQAQMLTSVTSEILTNHGTIDRK